MPDPVFSETFTSLPGDDRALRAVSVQFFVNGAVLASYIPRLPGIRDRLDVDLATIGTVLALATLAGFAGSVLVSSVIARFGTRSTMLAAGTLLVVLLPLVGVVTTPLQLLIALGLIQAADVFTDVAMNLQGSALSQRRTKPVINRLHGMWSVGTVIGGGVAALMVAWEVPLAWHLVVSALVLLLAVLYVAPGLRVDNDEPETTAQPSELGVNRPGMLVVLFALLGGTAIVPEVISSDWSAFRLADDLETTGGVAGLGFVCFTAGMVIGRFFGDGVVARLGSFGTLRASTALAAVGVLVASLVPVVVVVLIALFVAGLGISVLFPQLYDTAAKSGRSGVALGALTGGSRIALFVAPAVVGALASEPRISVGTAIAVVAGPCIAALFLYGLSQRGAKAVLGQTSRLS